MDGGNGAPNQRPLVPSRHPHAQQCQYKCSFCHRSFATLQSLGGHQTTHRQQIVEMRRQHEEYMSNKRKRGMSPPPKGGIHELTMELLAPNNAYWEEYRRNGKQPEEIDFVQVPNHRFAHAAMDWSGSSSDNTVTDPFMVMTVEQEEEVSSLGLDLTLKL